MSKFVLSSRVMSSGLFALLAASALGSMVGCAKPEEEATKQAWSCARDEVPMGEVVRCTSSALTADGPLGGTTGGTSDGTTTNGTTTNGTTTNGTTTNGTTTNGTTSGGTTSDGATSDGTTVYECGPGYDSLDCPPADSTDGTTDNTGASGGTTDGTGTSGGTTSGGTSGTDNGTTGTSSGGTSGGGVSSGGASGNGKSNGHTTDGTGPGNSSGGGAGGGTSHQPGPDECSYVPDLDYCGGTGGGTSDGTTSGGTDCGKPNCSPPGQDKKSGGTTDGTGASSSSGGSGSDGASNGGSSGGSTTGKGKHFTCKKDKKGNKSCVSTPACATGCHAATCGACVTDSEGTADCIPPTEGGCWVTGGGFIEGASLVPAAAADGHDNLGGNAKPMKRGDVSGHWNHVDHGTGNHAKGRPEYIMCRTTEGPGPGQPGGKKGLVANQVYFGGHAQWRTAASATWSDGYWFDVVAEDHGEPGNTSALKNGQMPDSYHFTLRAIDDRTKGASGVVVYETRGDLVGGNIQLHPSNNGHPAVNSPLPAWVSVEP